MTRKMNAIVADCISVLKSYPKSKKFDEKNFFSEESLSIIEDTTRAVVQGRKEDDGNLLNEISLLNDLLHILKNGKNNPVRFFVANLIKQLYISTQDKSITIDLVSILNDKDINRKLGSGTN